MPKRNKQSKREKKAQLRAQKNQSPLKSEPENELPSPKNKTWKRVAVFDKYEEAAAHKTKMLSGADDPSLLEVKIKRCGSEGSKFQVKLWSSGALKDNRKDRKKQKKGKL